MAKILVIGSKFLDTTENETLISSESELDEVINEDFDKIQIKFDAKKSPMYYFYRKLERLYKLNQVLKKGTKL